MPEPRPMFVVYTEEYETAIRDHVAWYDDYDDADDKIAELRLVELDKQNVEIEDRDDFEEIENKFYGLVDMGNVIKDIDRFTVYEGE